MTIKWLSHPSALSLLFDQAWGGEPTKKEKKKEKKNITAPPNECYNISSLQFYHGLNNRK